MKKGFTLLEMLIPVILLTVGITSILRIFSMVMIADTNLENVTIARYLAQEAMEEVKDADSYLDIDDFASERTDLTGDFDDFDRAVTVSGGDPKQVDVIVYWTEKGQDKSVDLVTLFTDYDYDY